MQFRNRYRALFQKEMHASMDCKTIHLDCYAEECLQTQTSTDLMQKVTKEIRSKLKNTITDFTVSFTNELLMAFELMVFSNFLFFGKSSDEFRFSMTVKLITQIILYIVKNRVRSNSTSTHQQHNTKRELPFLLYVSLKKYFITRSTIVILHVHGLCIFMNEFTRFK